MKILLVAALSLIGSVADASPIWIRTSCGRSALPLSFKIDCTRLTDPISKANCPLFLEDVACDVFPIYRDLVGHTLEQDCTTLSYTIYTDENWPHGDAGGMTLDACHVAYRERHSVNPGIPSDDPFGGVPPTPAVGLFVRDAHEILHAFHFSIASTLVDVHHPLFESSMSEVHRQTGTKTYQQVLSAALAVYNQHSSSPANCRTAQGAVEASLYATWLQWGSTSSNVVRDLYFEIRWLYGFYAVNDPSSLSVYNRVLAAQNGGTFKKKSGATVSTKAYLIGAGCPAF